ncbi:MAG: RidA family protein [Bacillota bacterium]|uniref:RidA family protein n=1 Tax=Thermanaerosceptrum fracticalcis TaxID=1712410 RepID=A0A7G6E1S7_THEFR|nr:RidA family protein [Thermanaerosceptrum fracticalcis]QNB46031.1 RidA family protein [Thermanaerosceptrum fracticalcis]
MSKIQDRLEQLGILLDEPPSPVAAYVPAVTFLDKLVYVSGQDCRKNGKLIYEGLLGRDLTVQQGYECARQSAINCLAVLKQHIGDLEKVKRVVKVLGFVASAPGFEEQPYVINGGSELFETVFGENGKHARSAIGTNQLPFGTPVEIEVIFELK